MFLFTFKEKKIHVIEKSSQQDNSTYASRAETMSRDNHKKAG